MNNSRRALCVMLAALAVALPACGETNPPVESTAPTETTAAPAEAAPTLDLLSMPIVRPDTCSALLLDATIDLHAVLKAKNGDVALTTDWVKKNQTPDPNAIEILVGETNRPATQALREELLPGTFGIAANEHQLVIVGTDYFESWRGVRYFVDELLTGNTPGVTVEDGAIRVEVGFRYVSEQTAPTAPSTILNSTDTFFAKSQLAFNVPRIGNYKTMQGGCVTEDYCYFALINTIDFPESAVEAYIVKYDRETQKLVKRSKSIVLDHANDITYIPETNELYVVSCYVDSRRISVLDADTLEFKERLSLQGGSDGAYALEYNPLRQTFVSGCGRVNMNLYDASLAHEKFLAGKSTTLVTQGICADDKYVYHVLYSAKSNTKEPKHLIFVFDWDGNFISSVELGIPKAYEPENISLVGDTFYIACNNSDWTGGIVFTATIEKR